MRDGSLIEVFDQADRERRTDEWKKGRGRGNDPFCMFLFMIGSAIVEQLLWYWVGGC